MTKVLMLSNDPKILDKKSDAYARMIEYGTLFEELHVVVFTKKNFQPNNNFQISKNVWIYPTNGKAKLFSFWEAYIICKHILNLKSKIINLKWTVTAQDAFTAIPILLLKMHRNVLFQIQIHTDFSNSYFWKESARNFIYYLIYRVALRHADCIRVVSKRILNSIKSNVKCQMSNVSILPIFVDIKKIIETPITTDLHKKYPQFDFIILMASRLTKEKNISLAVETFKEVATKYPKAGLCIVGKGPEKKNYELRIKNYRLEKKVVFEDWADKETLVSYYKTADIFLLTSDYEGYGLTLVEAAASGCPVVTTNVGLVGEVLSQERDVLVCEPRDKKCFVRNIANSIESLPLRAKLAGHAREAVQAIEISKEEYLKKYKESLEVCQK